MKVHKLSVLLLIFIVLSSCKLNKPNTKSGIGGNTVPEDNITTNENIIVNNDNFCILPAKQYHTSFKLTLKNCFVTANWADIEISDEYFYPGFPDAKILDGQHVYLVADITVENLENPFNSDNIISARAFRVRYFDNRYRYNNVSDVPVVFMLNEKEKVKWIYDASDKKTFHSFDFDVGETAEIRLAWKIRKDNLSDLKLLIDSNSGEYFEVQIEKGLYILMHPDFKEG